MSYRTRRPEGCVGRFGLGSTLLVCYFSNSSWISWTPEQNPTVGSMRISIASQFPGALPGDSVILASLGRYFHFHADLASQPILPLPPRGGVGMILITFSYTLFSLRRNLVVEPVVVEGWPGLGSRNVDNAYK